METLTQTDPLLLLTADDEHASVLSCAGGEAVAYSRKAPNKDGRNEDGALVLPLEPDDLILAVADGCGGMPAAADAAGAALKTLRARRKELLNPELLSEGAMLAAFDMANQAVLDLRVGAATTLAAVLIEGGTARVFHAGDSMALIIGQRGRIKYQAIPHSPTGYALEAGLMSEAEAVTHEDRSVVLNVLGYPEMRVEIGPAVKLGRFDTVLVASDGLCDNMFTDEIVNMVRAGNLRKKVDDLAKTCAARMAGGEAELPGHADDLTIVAYRRRK